MKIFFKFCAFLLLASTSISCSIQSKQYDFFKNIVTKNDSEIPTPEWIIDWIGTTVEAFAINHEKSVYFATFDDHFIEYSNNQIVKIQGFFLKDRAMIIEVKDQNYNFLYNNNLISIDICNNWNERNVDSIDIIVKEQFCFGERSDYNYTNKLIMNYDQQIIALQFRIHPDYPVIQLRLNKYEESIYDM